MRDVQAQTKAETLSWIYAIVRCSVTCSILGLSVYFQCFICPHFPTVSQPLTV